jgi:hypothetical protein
MSDNSGPIQPQDDKYDICSRRSEWICRRRPLIYDGGAMEPKEKNKNHFVNRLHKLLS